MKPTTETRNKRHLDSHCSQTPDPVNLSQSSEATQKFRYLGTDLITS